MVLGMVGTIPIAYKGARYHIPVSIYLPDSYPGRPPTVVVTPTQGLVVVSLYLVSKRNGC